MALVKRMFLGTALAVVCACAQAAGLPPARDLIADAVEARRNRVPILVFFTSDSCPYCQEVLDLYLEPLHARGTYAGRLLIRFVEVSSTTGVRDFRGERIDHETFAAREGAFVTPLIRFYDHTGRELVPPIIGYNSPDFFAGDLELAIEGSLRRLRVEDPRSRDARPTRAACTPAQVTAAC